MQTKKIDLLPDRNVSADESIAALILKAKDQWLSLPTWTDSIDLTGAEKSALNPLECMRRLVQYGKQYTKKMHPTSRVDLYLESSDVLVSNHCVKVEDKEVAVKAGFIADSNNEALYGVAATLIAHTVQCTNSGIKDPLEGRDKEIAFVNVPRIDLLSSAKAFELDKESRAPAAVEQYCFSALKDNEIHAQIKIDEICSKLPSEYVKESANKVAVAKYVDTLNRTRTNKIIYGGRTFKSYLKKIGMANLTFSRMVMYVQISQQIRGNLKGRGATSAGYYNFAMSPSTVKTCARAREVMAIAELCGVKFVKTDVSGDFGMNLVRTLNRNGYSTVGKSGSGVLVRGKPVGNYRATEEVTLEVFEKTAGKPSVSKKNGVIYPDDYSALVAFGKKAIHFCSLEYLTPRLAEVVVEQKWSFFPTMLADSGQVYVTSIVYGDNRAPNATSLMERAVLAAYCKNVFPVTRVPFYRQDVYRDWFPIVVLPKIVRKSREGYDLFVTEEGGTVVEEDLNFSTIDNSELGASIAKLEKKNTMILSSAHAITNAAPGKIRDSVMARICRSYPDDCNAISAILDGDVKGEFLLMMDSVRNAKKPPDQKIIIDTDMSPEPIVLDKIDSDDQDDSDNEDFKPIIVDEDKI